MIDEGAKVVILRGLDKHKTAIVKEVLNDDKTLLLRLDKEDREISISKRTVMDYNEFNATFGERYENKVHLYRKKKDLTQQEFAEKIESKQQSISAIENGSITLPSIKVLNRIIEELGVPYEELYNVNLKAYVLSQDNVSAVEEYIKKNPSEFPKYLTQYQKMEKAVNQMVTAQAKLQIKNKNK